MAHALVRGDAQMLDDPLRSQSVAFGAGCVLAVVMLAAGAVLALVRPAGLPENAAVVLVRDTGALYVRVDGVLHPVPNLASARLILGSPATPVTVSESAIAGLRRGPQVGIPGAPAQIGAPLDLDEAEWSLCDVTDGDDAAETVLSVGRPGPVLTPLRERQAVLVASRVAASSTYLLVDGRRARVDLRDLAVVRALRLEDVTPQPVSQALLNSTPEAPPVRPPAIPGAGTAGPAALGPLPVGTVVRVGRYGAADARDELYVVLSGGVQRIDRTAADLIRFTVRQPADEPPLVPAARLADVPVADALDISGLPESVVAGRRSVLCVRWFPGQAGSGPKTMVAVADSVGDGGVQLAQADADGPNVDRVSLPSGRSVLVRAGAAGGNSAVEGPLYLLTDLGVLFGIHDDDTAEQLGITAPAVPAPWPMMAGLPHGPELNRATASVARDAVAHGPA